MDRDGVSSWLAAYELAWRTEGADPLATLFTEDAVYRQGPYEKPVVGFPAIVAMWDDGRDGPDEVFTMISDIVAIDGNTAVVRVEVKYGDPVTQEYRDLWVITFAENGRSRAFEEWPFWPGKPYTADQSID